MSWVGAPPCGRLVETLQDWPFWSMQPHCFKSTSKSMINSRMPADMDYREEFIIVIISLKLDLTPNDDPLVKACVFV